MSGVNSVLLKYPNGEPKPVLRGVFHIISALTFPQTVLLASLFVKKNSRGRNLSEFSVDYQSSQKLTKELFKFFIVGETQFIASSILHISNLKNTWIQTFDHICIYISLYGITNLLKMYSNSKILFLPNACFAFLGILNKLFRKDDRLNKLFLILTGLSGIIPLIKTRMPIVQRIIYYNIIINLVAEFICYTTKWPLADNCVFTYHEILHILSVINAYLILLFICNA